VTDEPALPKDALAAFRQALLQWGESHFRPFPWRETRDPYRILLAEILLHRTQVKQMAPVYESVTARYPDISSLAEANKNDLDRLLFPVGLHWRSNLVFSMALEISTRYGGQIPVDKGELLSLPGVSEYIAGAVRCFAWNEPEVLMDTNTVRITGRVMGWPTRDSSRRNARFRQALAGLLDPCEPRAFNYALLDLAHLVCLKRQPPLCDRCPLATWCRYPTKAGEVHECT
jgi:A/G-specific adenine glycosylase